MQRDTSSTVVVKNAAGNTAGTGTTKTKGVVEITNGLPTTAGTKYTATWTGAKGIYGKDEVTVTSAKVTSATAAATKIAIADSTSKDLTVNFTSLKAAGKVYIVGGKDDDKAKSALDAFDFKTASSYIAVSDAVKDTDTKVDIKNAISAEGTYYAVFVPDDTEKYAQVESEKKVISAVVAEYAMTEVASVKSAVATQSVMTAKDQFGNAIGVDKAADIDSMTPLNEKDSSLIGAAANVPSTTTNLKFEAGAASGNTQGTITITGTAAPTKDEVWVGQLTTAAGKKTNSYIVATCVSAATTAEDSEWSLKIVQIENTSGVLVEEVANGKAATSIADHFVKVKGGDKITAITGVSALNSKDIALDDKYYVADSYGNILTKAGSKTDIAINDGYNKTKTLTIKWNSDGEVKEFAYTDSGVLASTDIVTDYLGAKITITNGSAEEVEEVDTEYKKIAALKFLGK